LISAGEAEKLTCGGGVLLGICSVGFGTSTGGTEVVGVGGGGNPEKDGNPGKYTLSVSFS
jgi:hypothetical protein